MSNTHFVVPRTILVNGLIGAALAIGGCHHDQPAPEAPPPAMMPAPPPPPAPPPQRHSDQNVNLSLDLRRMCNIDDSDRAPKFDFDSSNLSSTDRGILASLSTCMTTGPLKGRGLKLVGRADPRGTPQYNVQLGEARAENVRDYLTSNGVDTSRLDVRSRGAADATGTDVETWRKDRRVDVDLRPDGAVSAKLMSPNVDVETALPSASPPGAAPAWSARLC